MPDQHISDIQVESISEPNSTQALQSNSHISENMREDESFQGFKNTFEDLDDLIEILADETKGYIEYCIKQNTEIPRRALDTSCDVMGGCIVPSEYHVQNLTQDNPAVPQNFTVELEVRLALGDPAVPQIVIMCV
ncbi:unnamed protein product [Hermetia illucens]|uniref:Uncharacterized protein n=1 Tax=Hermetia illucens TaxID=343691 RepID=A0A7R8UXU5_HERIL|nr:unnamed protein product [Hermetia illucens]